MNLVSVQVTLFTVKQRMIAFWLSFSALAYLFLFLPLLGWLPAVCAFSLFLYAAFSVGGKQRYTDIVLYTQKRE